VWEEEGADLVRSGGWRPSRKKMVGEHVEKETVFGIWINTKNNMLREGSTKGGELAEK
jgi:hypothetical protein